MRATREPPAVTLHSVCRRAATAVIPVVRTGSKPSLLTMSTQDLTLDPYKHVQTERSIFINPLNAGIRV